MAGLCTISMLTTAMSGVITAHAASETKEEVFPSADKVIAQAATLLGSPYAFGCKGYTGIYYQDSYKPLETDFVRNQGIDCSGLVYYTLTHLGYSTTGFSWNNPVPVDTYSILGYDIDGKKDILGLWINETESKYTWMQIFDEIKSRGVEDVLFVSIDGVSGLEDGAKAVFPNITVQRCVVHMIRNSMKYIPSKHYKAFTASLKKIYAASSLNACMTAFEKFKIEWSEYPGAVNVWINNIKHIEQLFNYSSAVRKIMYTTNAIESINADFRKVTRKGTFPNEQALYKVLYLRITELYRKWNDRPVSNWSLVRNQLLMNESISERFQKYENCH